MTVTDTPLLEMQNITKRFPGGVVANDGVSLSVQSGEIHGLLGENGAGKSTLMNVLFGLHTPDEGEIRFRSEPLDVKRPLDAIETGIGMVHQHFMLIPRLSVTENVVLGLREFDRERDEGARLGNKIRYLERLFSNNYADASGRIRDIANRYGLEIDPEEKIWRLDVGEQQRVEIIKALYRDVDLLILDEPTAVLTPGEVTQLFNIIQELVNDGLSVIFITHKLDEVTEITDRVTILRDGKVISTVETKTVDQDDLARMMVGREVTFDIERTEVALGDQILSISDLVSEDDRGVDALRGVDLELRRGEIVGVAGVSGNGQTELAECLNGLRKVKEGEIRVDAVSLANRRPKQFVEAGVSYIPEDRYEYGCAPDMSVLENLIMKDRAKFTNGPTLDFESARQHAERLVEEYDIRTSSVDTPAGKLSGGNLQKMIIARELDRSPGLLIAHQPTRGVDVGAIEYIQEILLSQRHSGTGILLISEKLDEIIQLSDRIVVMYEGEVVHEVSGREVDRDVISRKMAGQSKE